MNLCRSPVPESRVTEVIAHGSTCTDESATAEVIDSVPCGEIPGMAKIRRTT
jgi:hypothetical protein